MIETPAILTSSGDIRIHNREGGRIPLFFQDDDGNNRDMTGATVAFITESGVRKVLTPGVQAHELILILSPGDFQTHVDKKLEFIVRDESVTEMPVVWTGHVYPYGW